MHGAGTKMAITSGSHRPICLDLTRLISRVGRGAMTGIDRVELAYLERLPELCDSFFVLVRARREYFFLDRAGSKALLARLKGDLPWGRRDFRSRFYRRQSALRQCALSDLNRLAVKRTRLRHLNRTLRTICEFGLCYLNVGHSNIDRHLFRAIRTVPGARIVVLLHDVIPLDFPQYQRTVTVNDFSEKIKIISEMSDYIIFPSADVNRNAAGYLERAGRLPPSVIAHLGVEVAKPDRTAIPASFNMSHPYFVTLGTIEPRKNHELLLDIWQVLCVDPDAPNLLIVGQRGWKNDKVFSRLDKGPPAVFEFSDLSDGAVSALLQGSAGLLFPSLAEGFGLPPAEAALLGAPVVCSDLEVYREFLGDYPVYLTATERYLWVKAIEKLTKRKVEGNRTDNSLNNSVGRLPTWDDHFDVVLKVL